MTARIAAAAAALALAAGPAQAQVPPATGVTLTPSQASPAPQGTAVTFTAQGQSGYQYQFWQLFQARWTIVQPWSAASTWTLPGTAIGGYQVVVEVRTNPAGGTDAKTTVSFQIGNAPATGVTLLPSLASPQPAGTAVTFTAQGQGSSPTRPGASSSPGAR
jgi:cell wall-associated protease